MAEQKIEKLHYTLKEAAERFGMYAYVFSKKVRSGILNPPVRFLGNGEKSRMLFPKKPFDKWLDDVEGPARIDVKRLIKRG